MLRRRPKGTPSIALPVTCAAQVPARACKAGDLAFTVGLSEPVLRYTTVNNVRKVKSEKRERVRGSSDRGSNVIVKVFRNRTEFRLKNEENNFEFNAMKEANEVKQSKKWYLISLLSGQVNRHFLH